MRFIHYLHYLSVAAFALVPGALAMGSCGLVLDTFERVDGGPFDDPDAGDTDAAVCTHQSYPPFPTDTVDAGGDIEFVAAVRSIDLGESSSDAEPVGLDLDKTCTCLGEGPSCVPPTWANKNNCDARNGVDNAAAKIFSSIVFAVGPTQFGSGFYSQMAEKGEWSALIRVQGYNGQLNDDKVRFIMYTTPGYGDQNGGGGGVMPEMDPKWDGTDIWSVSSASLVDGVSYDNPKYFDDNAYVTEGTLVANLPETTVNLDGNDSHFELKLTAGTIMGSLQNPEGSGWRIVNGLLTARWKTTDIFASLGTFSAEGMSVCDDNGFIYNQLKETVCGSVDIASTLGGATLQCDALSFGMKIQTHPAALGPLFTPGVLTPNCPPEQDPTKDGCGLP